MTMSFYSTSTSFVIIIFSQKTISSHMIFLMEASISMHCALNLEVWKLKQIEWKEKRNVRNHIPIGKKFPYF